MSCVVELSDLAVEEGDDVGDVDEDDDNRYRISIPVETEDAIPTFDARDVDERLQEEDQGGQSIGETLVGFVWAALVEAHTQDAIEKPSDRHWTDIMVQLKTQADAIEKLSCKEIQGWDLESQAPDSSDQVRGIDGRATSDRSVLIVKKLPPAIQLAFRRSVLQPFAVCVVIALVIIATGLHCIAVKTPTYKYLKESSLPSTVAAASGVLVCACMSVLYAHRFQAPSNFAALALLTTSELVFAVSCGVAFDVYVVVVPLLLFGCGVVTLCALACRSSTVNNVAKPPHLVTASIVAILAVTAVSILVNEVLGAGVTLLSVAVASLGVLWTALVLNVIENTMTLDAHATAIVFFQADIVVVAMLVPTRLILQWWRNFARTSKLSQVTQSKSYRWRKSIPANLVTPAFWSDGLTPMASIKTCVPAPPTPLHPVRLIPGLHRVDGSTPSDTNDPIRASELTINVPFEPKFDRANEFGSPRRRSSISS